MLYKLKGNQEKVNEYIKDIERLKEKHKDDEEMMYYLNSLNIDNFDDILIPMCSVNGYKDSPIGFYTTRSFNGETDLYYADMKEKPYKDYNDSWLFRKKRVPYRLSQKYGKKWTEHKELFGMKRMSKYGVCDNPHQVIEHYKPFWNELITNRNKKFVVLMTPVFREDMEESGDWRWHKWGEYIGNQNPQHEYLYDDKHIDLVFTYNIIEIEEA